MTEGSVNFISYARNGDGGEQGLEFLSTSRFKDEDGEDADGFFFADGPDLIPVPVTNQMKPCLRSFTYEEERSTDGRKTSPTNGVVATLPRLLSGNQTDFSSTPTFSQNFNFLDTLIFKRYRFLSENFGAGLASPSGFHRIVFSLSRMLRSCCPGGTY